MFEIIKQYVPSNKYSIKCPYSMDPIGICVHNTANDASAKSEVNYMINNNNQVSYHVAIDDQYAVECVPFNRTAWHAGDGGSGQGNRKYISIEICYSRSGGSKFDQAEKNAARYIAMLLKEYGWDISHVKKHQDFSGKYCPHRTLDYGWQRFLEMISAELGNTVDNNDVAKSFKDRYQLIKWNGLDVHLYKGFNNGTYKLDLGLMSADGNPKEKALQTLDKIDYDVQVFAKVNCGYFVMTSGDDHGQHLGVEQGFTNDLAPKQQRYVTVCVNKDDSIEIMDASEYWKSAKEVKCAFTPFWVGLFNYNDADYYSTNFGDKRSLKNTQTALMRMADGQWVLAVFNTKCTCWDVRKFAKEYGAEFMCCLDSGGSSQMITEGTKRVFTGRAIANALCLYRVDLKQDDKPIEQEEKIEADKLKAEIESLKKELAEKNLFIESLKNANIGYGEKLKKAYQRIADLNSEISKLRGE